ncbi:MAG TPA: shikimate dehydrogenase [Nitrososphaeraceae archaeon]
MVSEQSIKTYCIIGDPIEHSLSPMIHNAAFSFLKLRSTYIAYKVKYSELEASIISLKKVGLAGFNVTIPHKTNVIKYIDVLDSVTKETGAVNTVQNVKGVLYGYNTDVEGFLRPLANRNINLNGMRILLLGAGGAARAVVAALSKKPKNVKISIANRNITKAEDLVKIGNMLGSKCESLNLHDVQLVSHRVDMIINTLPLGMNNEESIIDIRSISEGSIVYDIVYRPVLTNLLRNAKQAGAIPVYGYEMLLEQGAESFQIWTGIPAPKDVMKKALLGPFGEKSE